MAMWWNGILPFRTGFSLVIALAHNVHVTERAPMGFVVIVPGPGVTDFTARNEVARSGA